ncbi:MAG: hypothetical protein AAGA32_07050 [Pseudomonadota bacterium]
MPEAELAVTGICSGVGGMLAEEQGENPRSFHKRASGRVGFQRGMLGAVHANHFMSGRCARGQEVNGKIARA